MPLWFSHIGLVPVIAPTVGSGQQVPVTVTLVVRTTLVPQLLLAITESVYVPVLPQLILMFAVHCPLTILPPPLIAQV